MQLHPGFVLLATIAALGWPLSADAQAGMDKPDMMQVVSAKTLTWVDAEVPGFAPGMKMAVVSGDPAAAAPYTLRLSFPAGYKFPAHWHPMPESLTVLSGSFQLGMGEKEDASKLKTYGPGDFLFIPSKMAHFGGATTATVIQLHGTGPFTIELVGAAMK